MAHSFGGGYQAREQSCGKQSGGLVVMLQSQYAIALLKSSGNRADLICPALMKRHKTAESGIL
jgi:hypothetical protein